MLIPRKAIDRRAVLRGIGTTLALPLLEAMTAPAKAASTKQPARLQVFYMPNGMIMENFTPESAGAQYALSPTLKPLEPFRDKFSVVSGLAHYNAGALGDGAGDHGRSCGAFLTGAHPKRTDGYDIHCGVSLDQVVAKHFEKETEIASLEIGIDQPSLVGTCDVGYSCMYTNTLSWRSPTTPMPVTVNPRDVFERLFGDGDQLDRNGKLAQLRRRSSILDFVKEDAALLSRRLGAGDRRKMDEYTEALRDVERRIQKASADNRDTVTDFSRPAGVPESFAEHVRMMIDLQVLAMQADLTRVSTFMMGREISNRAYPEIDVADAHHMLSHHGGDPEKITKLTRINTLHMEQFAYLLKRMSETADGESTLLKSTMVLAGGSLGDPNRHDHMNLPIMVAGGFVKTGQHIRFAKDTPMCNLMVSILGKLEIPVDKIGDSTGALPGVMS